MNPQKILFRILQGFRPTRIDEIIFAIASSTAAYYFISKGLAVKDIGTIFLSGISTLIGARYAFLLTERRTLIEVREKRIHILNKALFSLARQLNAITCIREEIAPYSSLSERLFECKAAMPPDYSNLRINYQELSFLLDSSNPDLLFRISVEEDGFHQAIRSITIRAQYFVENFQPAAMHLSTLMGPVTLENARGSIGDLVFDSALGHTNSMFNALDQSYHGLRGIINELEELSRALYPDEKFLRFKLKKAQILDAPKHYKL